MTRSWERGARGEGVRRLATEGDLLRVRAGQSEDGNGGTSSRLAARNVAVANELCS